MTSRLHKDSCLLRSGDKRPSGELGRLFPLKHIEAGKLCVEMQRPRLDRPFLQQELSRFLGTRDDAVLSGLPGEHGYGLVPSFRVHGAAPGRVEA